MKKLHGARLVLGALSLVVSGVFAQGAAPAESQALLTDVQTLSSPAFAGRRTGTEGSELAQAYIAGRFKQIGLTPFGASYAMPFSFTAQRGGNEKTDFPAAANMVGYIRGSSHPERYIVVSAHYDHLGKQGRATYLGADDNASGVAAMLAVAAHFKQHPPLNSIVFAAFDGEELGLKGAVAFIDKPPIPLASIALNLNFDMVSRVDKNEIYASGTRYTPALRPLIDRAAAQSSIKVRFGHDSKVKGAPPYHDWTGSSDHGVFHKKGIPFLYFGVEDHADYHKPGDTFDKINPVSFAEVGRLLVSSAALIDQNLDTLK